MHPNSQLTCEAALSLCPWRSTGTYRRCSAHGGDNLNIEPGVFSALIFAPLQLAEYEPDVIFILCNARQAMEVLHANAYDSGSHGLGADSGPICSSMASLPLPHR
ncbi:DUF169 domain-containing protein [Methanothermobacter marburgensis]